VPSGRPDVNIKSNGEIGDDRSEKTNESSRDNPAANEAANERAERERVVTETDVPVPGTPGPPVERDREATTERASERAKRAGASAERERA
jgi:hypothetical protein